MKAARVKTILLNDSRLQTGTVFEQLTAIIHLSSVAVTVSWKLRQFTCDDAISLCRWPNFVQSSKGHEGLKVRYDPSQPQRNPVIYYLSIIPKLNIFIRKGEAITGKLYTSLPLSFFDPPNTANNKLAMFFSKTSDPFGRLMANRWLIHCRMLALLSISGYATPPDKRSHDQHCLAATED